MRRTIAIIVNLSCGLLILLFVYAAFSKLLDYEKFRLQLGQSPMLTAFALPIAVGIPLIEIAIAVLLFSTRWRLLGLYASFTLMVMFTAYIIAITRYSEFIPCSCGGVLQNMSWNEHLYFNLSFVVLSGSAILLVANEHNRRTNVVQNF
jgi:hypothetical protein